MIAAPDEVRFYEGLNLLCVVKSSMVPLRDSTVVITGKHYVVLSTVYHVLCPSGSLTMVAKIDVACLD